MTKFSSTYPDPTAWTESYGWIEIEQNDFAQSSSAFPLTGCSE